MYHCSYFVTLFVVLVCHQQPVQGLLEQYGVQDVCEAGDCAEPTGLLGRRTFDQRTGKELGVTKDGALDVLDEMAKEIAEGAKEHETQIKRSIEETKEGADEEAELKHFEALEETEKQIGSDTVDSEDKPVEEADEEEEVGEKVEEVKEKEEEAKEKIEEDEDDEKEEVEEEREDEEEKKEENKDDEDEGEEDSDEEEEEDEEKNDNSAEEDSEEENQQEEYSEEDGGEEEDESRYRVGVYYHNPLWYGTMRSPFM